VSIGFETRLEGFGGIRFDNIFFQVVPMSEKVPSQI